MPSRRRRRSHDPGSSWGDLWNRLDHENLNPGADPTLTPVGRIDLQFEERDLSFVHRADSSAFADSQTNVISRSDFIKFSIQGRSCGELYLAGDRVDFRGRPQKSAEILFESVISEVLGTYIEARDSGANLEDLPNWANRIQLSFCGNLHRVDVIISWSNEFVNIEGRLTPGGLRFFSRLKRLMDDALSISRDASTSLEEEFFHRRRRET